MRSTSRASAGEPKAAATTDATAPWSAGSSTRMVTTVGPLPALVGGVAALAEGGHALVAVDRGHHELLRPALLVEGGVAAALEAAVDEPLGHPDRLRGAGG